MAAQNVDVKEHVDEEEEGVAWSVSSTRILIEFYKKNRVLWDKNCQVTKTKMNKVLSPLQAKLQKASPPRSLNDIKKRWHGLRSMALRYMKKSTSQQENIKWVYWSDLSFLRETVTAGRMESEMEWSDQEIETLIAFYQGNESLWNHNNPQYHQDNNKDLLYDMLMKDLEDKYDTDDIKKKWKELVKKFKLEHSKASVKPSGSGTTDTYTPAWEFYGQLKFLTAVCDDTDETVDCIEESSKPKDFRKASKQQQRDDRENRKLELLLNVQNIIRATFSALARLFFIFL